MYGKKETVEYLRLDLLWGAKYYKQLRFVLVQNFSLSSEDIRRKIAENGMIKTLNEYSLQGRLEKIFSVAGLV